MTGWDDAAFTRELAAAVDVYDRTRVEELCDGLILHIRKATETYSPAAARATLRQLRRKRWFDLMTRIADVLLQSGQRHPYVRCEYAQALTDRGTPGVAAELLAGILEDTDDPGVRAEALGMLGRAYKQMSLDSAVAPFTKRSDLLMSAVRAYGEMYGDDPTRCAWHGINAAALLCYAERHGVSIRSPIDAAETARRVLGDVEGRFLDPAADRGPWDAALAAEACLILDLPEESVRWMQRYATDGRADAFELASTLRQLLEVWELDAGSEPGSRLLPILRAQMLTRQEGASLHLSPEDAGRVATAEPDSDFEKVLGDAGVVTHSWYRQGLRRSRAVALVRHRSGRAVGTGFLARGVDFDDRWEGPILITNSHVVSTNPSTEETLTPEQAAVSFEAVGDEGAPATPRPVETVLWSSPPRELDCTVLRVNAAEIEPCPITTFRPRLDGKQRVYVIGHPEGRELSYSIDDNLLLDYDDRVLHYRAPTEHGSSGSPVFNRDWEVIGLHHSGRNDMPRLHGGPGTYPANEGIWIQAIRTALAEA